MNQIINKFVTKSEKINLDKIMREAKSAERRGDLHVANEIYQFILKKFPKNKRAKKALANLISSAPMPDLVPLIKEERYEEVERILTSNIDRDKGSPHFWRLLAIVYKETKQYSLAIQCYEKAITLAPTDHELVFETGCLLLELNDLKNAYKAFKHVIAMDQNSAGAFTNVGEIYYRIQKIEEASKYWNEALSIDPEDSIALTMLGLTAADNQGNYDLALDYFQKALSLRPDDVNLYVNIATVYCEMGQPKKSIEIFESWAKRNWDGVDAEKQHQFDFNYSLALFNAGRLPEAWKLYKKRIDMGVSIHTQADTLAIPRLEDLRDANGAKLVLLREQGIGDQIFFLGILNKFLERCNCEIILQVEPRLTTILKRSFPNVQITSEVDITNIDADFWLPYADMAYLLEFHDAEQQLSFPYISPMQDKVDYWHSEIDQERLRVGLCWRSGLIDPRRMRNFTFLSDWAELIDHPKIQPICLQYSDISEDLEELTDSQRSRLFMPQINLKDDFEDLGAIMKVCDIVIGPFGAPVWQSSAIGCRTLVCNLKGFDNFAFGRAQTDGYEYTNPWYPNCSHMMYHHNERKQLVGRVHDFLVREFSSKMTGE